VQTTSDQLLYAQLAALNERVKRLEEFERTVLLFLKSSGQFQIFERQLAADLQSGKLVEVDNPDGSPQLYDGPNSESTVG
jgi:hypothetical protein